MIALYLDWSGEPLTPAAATRVAAALAVGTKRKPVTQELEGVLFASAFDKPQRPIRLPSGMYLLFYGHIDNRAKLRRELGSQHGDDAALYAAAYAASGDAADLRVIGEYCTIAYDPAHRRVRIGRAPIAGPPLHYFRDDKRLIIATTPRAIFATGLVEQKADEQKIADSLYLNYYEGERSWFEGISRLMTATRMVFTPGRVHSDTYYDPLNLPQVRFKTDQEYVEAADALFEEGTRGMLDGFSKPAISISGGFDSQAVAAYALRVMPPEQPLLGLTSVPEAGWDGNDGHPERFGDETAHAQAFAAMYKDRFDHVLVDAAGLSIDHHMKSMFLLGSAAPRNAMNLHWIHEVHSIANARGCDVLLTGAMGNLSFSYNSDGALQTWFKRGQWRTLIRELRAMKDGRSLPRKFISAAFPFAPEWIQRLNEGMRGIHKDVMDGWCGMNPAYADEMRVAERAVDMGHDPHYRRTTNAESTRQVMLSNDRSEAGDIRQAFNLIHGIPSRDPTSYRPLMEFCLSIPDEQFLRNGTRRYLARRMLRGMIPDMVLDENRLGSQAADWALRLHRQRGELLDELDSLARDPAMAHRFNLPALKATLEGWDGSTPDSGDLSKRLQLALTRSLTTARFIRFVDGSNR